MVELADTDHVGAKCDECGRIKAADPAEGLEVEVVPEVGWMECTAMVGNTVHQVKHVCPWCWDEFLGTMEAVEDENAQ